jgi:sarcosine/dimethylglycine N-methyltransferase
VHTARDYYNSDDADNFYYHVWGGNDIHVGLYSTPDEDIDVASRRTVERMVQQVEITPETRILDIGAGYGGAARYLASTFGCKVTCLNLSEVENARNEEFNRAQGLEELIEVTTGSFEDIPFQDNAFDLVWSQDAILHSGDRPRVLEEVTRVLRPGGSFLFTDPMAADGAAKRDLGPILDRLHLDTLGSPGFYRRELARLGLHNVDFEDLSGYLPQHYGRVLEVFESREAELSDRIGEEYRSHMKTGLQNWVNGGKSGNLAWGIFHARA